MKVENGMYICGNRQKTVFKDLNEEVLAELPNVIIGEERVIYICGIKFIPSGSSLSIDLDNGAVKTIYLREINENENTR